ncbi:TIGR01777 family oxidoreductase [Acinetobacter stercoris]|uniref:Epimerase family protein n=1 Tax=Acinetobacter stercoris TaxID=2126983 RepID=A0A2U3N0G6_9GAMM|nr:TIGR01777 family oxidoreductase [Acinetobacter stercoris]SPL71161.1 Epimerase family protein [Acinetobacter stercoris]
MYKATVLVTGATGFIGWYLIQYLLENRYLVIGLTRQKNKLSSRTNLIWINDFDDIQTKQIDFVVNLAGEKIGKGLWTEKRKNELLKSRIETTHNLYQWLNDQNIYPKCLISGSAVGYYGIDSKEQWNTVCSEDTLPQSIFMSQLCYEWEKAALKHAQHNTKIIRLGVVLGKKEGIFPRMVLPIRMNLIGKIGSGKQPLSWIHVDDAVRAIEFLFCLQDTQKIFNLVAPEHVCQMKFVESVCRILHKKTYLNLPGFLVQVLFGEQSQLMLNGQYISAERLINAGFEFKYAHLETALQHLLDVN